MSNNKISNNEILIRKSINLAILFLFIYVVTLSFFSIKNPWPTVLLSSIVALCFLLLSGVRLFESLNLLVVLLVAFDSEIFSISFLKLRVWYFLLLLSFFLELVNYMLFSWKEKRFNISNAIFLFYFIVLSVFSSINNNLLGDLYCVKYWLFTIGFFLWLSTVFKRIVKKYFVSAMSYITAVFLSVALFGLWQYLMNKTSLGSLYMSIPGNVRPEAFFSETTWYATFCFTGLVLLSYQAYKTKEKMYICARLIFLLGIFLSNTRNAFLGLSFFVFIEILLLIKKRKCIKRSTLKNLYLIVSVVVIGILLFWKEVNSIFTAVLIKFSFTDASALGRINAFNSLIADIAEKPLFGLGFNWDAVKDVIQSSGTAIGAKAFNVFLQVAYIFGIAGFVPFVIMVLYFAYKKWYLTFYLDEFNKYSLIFFCSFFLLSSFAPLHQFPSGILMLGLSNIVNIEKGRFYENL